MGAKREYREGRVRVTPEIRHIVLKLLIQEEDVGRKKKHPASWYRDEVVRKLNLTDKTTPSIRSFEMLIQPLRKRLQAKNPLDEPWTIGACVRYPDQFPRESIPMLLDYQNRKVREVLQRRGVKIPSEALMSQETVIPVRESVLTIRHAMWLVRLEPAVTAHCPKGEEILDLLHRAAIQYELVEYLSELNQQPLSTLGLDSFYFYLGQLPDDGVLDEVFVG